MLQTIPWICKGRQVLVVFKSKQWNQNNLKLSVNSYKLTKNWDWEFSTQQNVDLSSCHHVANQQIIKNT